jgi:hypothetical protein
MSRSLKMITALAFLGVLGGAAVAQIPPPPFMQQQGQAQIPPPPFMQQNKQQGQDQAAKEREAQLQAQRAADRRAFFDARVAAVKAGLQLTPVQEQYWPQAEAAVRRFVDEMTARREAARQQHEAMREGWRARRQAMMEGKVDAAAPDPLARMRARADNAIAHGNSMRALVDAVAPLYNSLTPEQKARLPRLAGRRMWREQGRAMEDGFHGRHHDQMPMMGFDEDGPRGHRGHRGWRN